MPNAAGQPTLDDVTAYSGLARLQLVERFQRSSFLFQQIPFFTGVTPNVQQGILAYTYARTKTQRGVAFRNYYEDYTPQVAEVDQVTVNLKPFGGSIEIDRVFADADALRNRGPEIATYLEFQNAELALAGVQKFHDSVINGNSAIDLKSYDGLSKILTGTAMEINGRGLDLTTAGDAQLTNFWNVQNALLRQVNKVRSVGQLPVIICNEEAALLLSSMAARMNYRDTGVDAFGATVNRFAGAPIIDAGVRPGTAGTLVIPTTSGDTVTPSNNGLTDIYVVGLGLGGVHAVTLTGDRAFRIYTNLFDGEPGVTKRYEIELVTALVVKQERAAYVIRNVRVAPGV
jgi:hypothetical protein